jgi:hypothetical protein
MRCSHLRPFAASLLVVVWSAGVCGANVVVPNSFETSDGNASFAGPLSRFARTYQLLVDDSQLTGVVGHQITGVTWRLPGSTASSWPAADVNYASFDIYLSGSVEPANRSLTFADNIVGPQAQVRAGALVIPANSFTDVTPGPSPFGFVINFDSPYAYAGGNLLLELRQSAHDGTDRSVDAASTSAATGYGTLFSALWGSGNTATTGIQGNAVITQFVTVIPEPATTALLMLPVASHLIRRPKWPRMSRIR